MVSDPATTAAAGASGAAPRAPAAATLLRRLGAAVVLPLLLLAGAGASAAPRELDRVVAIVDDGVVLASELVERMQLIEQQIEASGRPAPPRDALASQVLERLILESLQLQMGDRAGVRLSDEEITSAIERLAAQNGMPLPQFIQAVQQDGLSYREFREQIRREMVIARVQQNQVNGRIRITPREVEGFLESPLGRASTADEYRVAHILLTVADDADPRVRDEALAQARDLIEQARAGADFAALAIEHSSASTALEGGDLGWRSAGQLPTLFAEPVLDADAGEVLDPIETESAIHVVKLVDKRGLGTETVDQTHVRHILVRPNEIRSDQEARELIQQIADRLEAGEDFGALAREYSDDPGSALRGGDLDWVEARQLDPAFASVMEASPVGEVSEPFPSSFGYHILEVLERREQDVGQEARERQAFMILRQRRFDEELQAWLQELREDAFVEIKI
jgi:peptidyl-prolyl cis-trans isomerase SurA